MLARSSEALHYNDIYSFELGISNGFQILNTRVALISNIYFCFITQEQQLNLQFRLIFVFVIVLTIPDTLFGNIQPPTITSTSSKFNILHNFILPPPFHLTVEIISFAIVCLGTLFFYLSLDLSVKERNANTKEYQYDIIDVFNFVLLNSYWIICLTIESYGQLVYPSV